MGEDIDFYELKGAPRSDVLHVLYAIIEECNLPVADPELLAMLIDGYAGSDLDARSFGLEAERRKLRRELSKNLGDLHATALRIINTPENHTVTSPFLLAVADLIMPSGSEMERMSAAERHLRAIRMIAAHGIHSPSEQFAVKPSLDMAVTRVVTAVADYCARLEIPFTGEPRRIQADNKAQYLPKSYAARLTQAVLDRLEINYRPAELATHMKKARKLVSST